MAVKMTDGQLAPESGANETKDESMKGANVKTDALSDGAIDHVAGGLTIKLKQVYVTYYSHGTDNEPVKKDK